MRRRHGVRHPAVHIRGSRDHPPSLRHDSHLLGAVSARHPKRWARRALRPEPRNQLVRLPDEIFSVKSLELGQGA